MKITNKENLIKSLTNILWEDVKEWRDALKSQSMKIFEIEKRVRHVWINEDGECYVHTLMNETYNYDTDFTNHITSFTIWDVNDLKKYQIKEMVEKTINKIIKD